MVPSRPLQTSLLTDRLASAAQELSSAAPGMDRARALLQLASKLPRLPESERIRENRVMGCTSQVWVSSRVDQASGQMHFVGDSDSEISRALAALLCSGLSGLTPQEISEVDPAALLAALGLGAAAAIPVPSRSSGAMNVLETILKRARIAAKVRSSHLPPSCKPIGS